MHLNVTCNECVVMYRMCESKVNFILKLKFASTKRTKIQYLGNSVDYIWKTVLNSEKAKNESQTNIAKIPKIASCRRRIASL